MTGLARHPLNDPTPAGATVAGAKRVCRQIRVRPFGEERRDGHKARPVQGVPAVGATITAGTSPSLADQPLLTGSATKRLFSPFFTRISTVRLPSDRTAAIA